MKSKKAYYCVLGTVYVCVNFTCIHLFASMFTASEWLHPYAHSYFMLKPSLLKLSQLNI